MILEFTQRMNKKPSFEELEKYWYDRLKKEGFKDIEKKVGNERVLIQRASNVYRQATEVERENKRSYYELISSHVQHEQFTDPTDELIMCRRAEGITIKEISAELKKLGERCHRQTIRFIIRKYELKWKVRNWNPDQLATKKMPSKETVKPLKSSYSVVPYQGQSLPESYKNLVYAKWLRSLRYGNDYFKLIDSDSYFKAYHKYIEHLLSRPSLIVRFAVLTEDPDVVLGFSVSEGTTLHYVHVHMDNRRLGIGRSLVPFEVKTITHITKIGLSIWNAKMPHAVFNPFA